MTDSILRWFAALLSLTLTMTTPELGWSEQSSTAGMSPANTSKSPTETHTEAHTQSPDLDTVTTVSIGVRPDLSAWGEGGGGELGVTWPISQRFTLDACGRAGYLRRSGDDQDLDLSLDPGPDPDLLYLALAFGPTWNHAINAMWSLRLGARVTHIHHASLASWGDTPWSNLAGDSSGGVLHRSGLELIIGLTGGEVFTLKGRRARWDVTLNLGRLPSSVELRTHAGIALGLRL